MRDNSFIMELKTILRIAAFSTAFIFSAAIAGLFIDESASQTEFTAPLNFAAGFESEPSLTYDSAVAAKIYRLLEKDDDNGRARNDKTRRFIIDYNLPFASNSLFAGYADATAQYAEQSGSMKQDGLSPEFKSAWRRHMKAWRDYADFLQRMKNPAVRSNLGEAAFNDFDAEYNNEINQSWSEVLRIAIESGTNMDWQIVSD